MRNTKTLRKPAQVRRGAATSRRSTKGPSRSAASLSAQTRPPLPGQGKRGENGYLGYLLRQAQAAARLTLERALADLEVTPPQFVVLTMLKAYPGLSGADLARVALLTPQTIGLIIANLERSGAIRKTPHLVHGRVLQWSLSPKGNTLLTKCHRRAQTLERRLATGLTPRNEAVVRRWLAGIAARMAT